MVKTNLISGMLALTFVAKEDYDKIKKNDTFDIIGLIEFTPSKPLIDVINQEEQIKEEILVNHSYNEQQIEWFKAGGALNVIRREFAKK